MANVNAIIAAMQTIINSGYQSVHAGPLPSRPTGHMLAFRNIQGNAQQIHAILSQNPNPPQDSQENIEALFASMGENIRLYCQKTEATRPVLIAFNNGYTDWQVLNRQMAATAR
jgi:hypothetical protein